MFEGFFDTTLFFLLRWPPVLSVLFVSLVISVLIVVVYKFVTDQKEMKRLKDDLSGYQKKMKELKDEPEKMMAVQKKLMQVNMQYMSKSMKPTLITFIPIILLFNWMTLHFAYEPLMANQSFSATVLAAKDVVGNVSLTLPQGLSVDAQTKDFENGVATFMLNGTEGKYLVTFASNGKEVDANVIITSGREYAPIVQTYKDSVFKSVTLGNKKLYVLWSLSWLWVYIISAVAFSTILRKVLKVY